MSIMRTLTINGTTYNVTPVVPASSVTLLAGAWVGDGDEYSQVVELPGVTPHTKVDLQPTADQLAEFYYKVLAFVAENDGGVVRVFAIGDKPKGDHTIQTTLTEVETTGKIRGNTVGTPMPRSNFNQTDPKKADYIVGREKIVQTVNGVAPDENGNVEVQGGGGGSGEPGADGFSPVANVTQTASGAVISITDKSGTTTATVFNGKDGKDGYTPVKGVDYFDGAPGAAGKDGVSATHSWNGTTLTITSASGTSSANLKGEKGDKGDQGIQGIQGIQGEKGDTGAAGSNGTNGTSVTVKSVSESTADGGSNVVTFSDGKTVTIKNGSKGSTGATGSQGPKGDTGATGATGAAGKNGADGYTPVRGVDYYTEADKVEIVQRVIESLGGNPIFGIVDENNNIVVSGDLPDGTYSVKYEMENGTKLNIGNLVIDTNVYYTVTNTLTQCTTNNSATKAVQGGSYSTTITAKSGYELKSIVVKMGGTDISSTAVSGGKITISNVTGNIVITAVAEEIKAAYTNILTSGKYTIEKNKRWSGSAKSFTACNGMIGFLVPTADVLNKTIRFKGFTKDLMASGQAPMWMNLDAGKARLNNIPGGTGNGNIWAADALVDEGNGVYSVTVNATFAAGSSAYIVIDMAVHESTAVTSLDGLIMTINEPIA